MRAMKREVVDNRREMADKLKVWDRANSLLLLNCSLTTWTFDVVLAWLNKHIS